MNNTLSLPDRVRPDPSLQEAVESVRAVSEDALDPRLVGWAQKLIEERDKWSPSPKRQ